MDNRRKELGQFLQAMRQRSTPEAFGFPSGTRRRTQGLRREEVAQLAGLSATWYTWMEQGREINVSAEALHRLASALKLTRTERAYLFDISDRHDPHSHATEQDGTPEALMSMLPHIQIPAYILGRTWNVLAWNPHAKNLFAGWLDQNIGNDNLPNLIQFVFLNPLAQHFVVDWEMRARRLVAEFRADCRSRLEEPALKSLVTEIAQRSPAFAQFWKQHDVLERQGGLREFNHPTRGVIAYEQVTLRLDDQDPLKLVLLNPIA